MVAPIPAWFTGFDAVRRVSVLRNDSGRAHACPIGPVAARKPIGRLNRVRPLAWGCMCHGADGATVTEVTLRVERRERFPHIGGGKRQRQWAARPMSRGTTGFPI